MNDHNKIVLVDSVAGIPSGSVGRVLQQTPLGPQVRFDGPAGSYITVVPWRVVGGYDASVYRAPNPSPLAAAGIALAATAAVTAVVVGAVMVFRGSRSATTPQTPTAATPAVAEAPDAAGQAAASVGLQGSPTASGDDGGGGDGQVDSEPEGPNEESPEVDLEDEVTDEPEEDEPEEDEPEEEEPLSLNERIQRTWQRFRGPLNLKALQIAGEIGRKHKGMPGIPQPGPQHWTEAEAVVIAAKAYNAVMPKGDVELPWGTEKLGTDIPGADANDVMAIYSWANWQSKNFNDGIGSVGGNIFGRLVHDVLNTLKPASQSGLPAQLSSAARLDWRTRFPVR